MKILLAHNSYQQPGGEDVVFGQEAALLADAGHEVVTFTRSNNDLRLHGVVNRAAALAGSVWSSRTYREVAAIVRERKIDVAHIHNTHLVMSPSVVWACHDHDVPVIQTLHNYRLLCAASSFYRDGGVCEECVSHGLRQAVRRRCFQQSRARTSGVVVNIAVHRALGTWEKAVNTFIALTPFAKRKFVEGGLPAERVVVKPNFVSPDPGYSDKRGNYIIYAGRLTPEKGVLTLVNAMREVPPDIPLMIVGDGPARPQLEQSISDSGLQNVVVLGPRTRVETLGLIKGARLLIFPSEWYETFGLTIIEAMACGVPVIASRIGVVTDTITDGSTGLLFAPADHHALANTIARAWNDPESMRSISRNARREFEAKYSAERNLRQLLAIYSRTLDQAAAAA